jgi:glycine cleavage system H lipoate-binding protein
LVEESRLCDVICDDGSRYKVRSSIKGHLLEMNERLKEEPHLLNSKASTEGFIAIIRPKKEEETKVCSKLLTEEKYLAMLQNKAT